MAIDISLELLGPCNYNCSYCIGDGPANRYPVPVLHDLKRLKEVYATLEGREAFTTVHARGTEPALHPQVADIARIVVPAGTLHISTNLSVPVRKWLPGPVAIRLLVTIHPMAQEDLPSFMLRVEDAVRQGYDVQVQALGDEDRPEWREMLVEVGVTRPFKVLKIRQDSRWRAQNKEISPPPPGCLCNAGHTSLFVTAMTDLLRCRVGQEGLRAPLPAPAPCPRPQADTRCEAYWIKEN